MSCFTFCLQLINTFVSFAIILVQDLRAAGLTVSGWDMKDVRFQHNPTTDELHIGINCFGICGDADGDGDSGRTSSVLAGLGGSDLPKYAFARSVFPFLNATNVAFSTPRQRWLRSIWAALAVAAQTAKWM